MLFRCSDAAAISSMLRAFEATITLTPSVSSTFCPTTADVAESSWEIDEFSVDERLVSEITDYAAANRSTYLDAALHLDLNEDFVLDTSAQYLCQNENAGNTIDDDKTSFSGFGSGTLYTNMENMILDAIVGGDADAMMAGISYQISDFSLYYMYGVYERDQTSTLAKEEIIELNIGADYSVNENLILSAILTIDDDKEDTASNAIYTEGDFTNFRVSVAYTF